jgi:O-antigen/teichoic acid export membrane protein
MKEVEEIYYKSARYMIVLGGLIFLGININVSYMLSFLPNEYADGIWVVFIVSISALTTMGFGSNAAMIFNSEHYRFGVFLLLFLVASAFLLNIMLIPIYGIEGAAIATAASAILYNLLRYFFIWAKYKLQPLSIKTLFIVAVIFICWIVNHFIPDTNYQLINIAIHSVIITLLYCVFIYFLNVIPEFHHYVSINYIKSRISKRK